MRVIGLIRNFFFVEVLGLVARYSRTLLFYNSELLERKRIDRARVDNKVDRKDVYAAYDFKQRL